MRDNVFFFSNRNFLCFYAGYHMSHDTLLMMSRDSKNISILNSTISSNNNNNSMNISGTLAMANLTGNQNRLYTTAEPVEIFFLIVLMVVILFGNSMVCCAFSTVERSLRTVTNYFVINLAVSDILVGTFSMSLWLCIRTGKIVCWSFLYNVCSLIIENHWKFAEL